MYIVPKSGLLRLGKSQVRFDFIEITEFGLGFLIGDRGGDDDIISGLPIDGGDYTFLIGQLQSVNDSQHFRSVSPDGGGVGKDQSDLLLGVDDKDGPHCFQRTVVDVLEPIGVHHVVQEGHVPKSVPDNGEPHVFHLCDFFDVLNPLLVGLNVFHRKTNQLDVPLVELRFQFGKSTDFSGAYGCKICGMREQDPP